MHAVTPTQCELFYPFVIGLDDENQIVYLSERLNAKLDHGCVGRRFDKVFELSRPRVDWKDNNLKLADYSAHLFLFANLSGTFGLRGQVIPGTLNGRSIVLIAASPWLTWLNENVEHYQPNFFDFSVQDAQLDFNLHLHTQTIMLDDMQRLAEQLMRARDEAQDADRAKTTFVSHVSHELRTPLTGITGMIELLEDQPLNEESLELLDTLRTSSDYLMHIVNQILDFSRMKDGADRLLIKPFNLTSTVNSIVSILAPQAAIKGLKLSVFISPNIPKWLDGDVFKIGKSLTNLISNAIKYSDSGIFRSQSWQLRKMPARLIYLFRYQTKALALPRKIAHCCFENSGQRTHRAPTKSHPRDWGCPLRVDWLSKWEGKSECVRQNHRPDLYFGSI